MIFAGTPATIEFGGTGFVTTALAPIIEFLPILMPPNTIAPLLILTLSSIVGTPGYLLSLPYCNLLIYRYIITYDAF